MNTYKTYGYPQQAAYQRCMPTQRCQAKSALPETVAIAMAYIPFQENNDVYSCDKALLMGTVFPVLDKPFLAGCCR